MIYAIIILSVCLLLTAVFALFQYVRHSGLRDGIEHVIRLLKEGEPEEAAVLLEVLLGKPLWEEDDEDSWT